jgi:hypothetical protein
VTAGDDRAAAEEVAAAALRRAAAVTDEVSSGGRDQAFHLRLTQTWIRTPEGWRCHGGHASLPAVPLGLGAEPVG